MTQRCTRTQRNLSSSVFSIATGLSEKTRHSLAFGIGRRICPGRHFVGATIFIVTSSVLSVFNATKVIDENGD